MTRIDYSFLDLTVLPFLRRLTISQDAAILFSVDLDRVLWANAFGVRLFSGDGLADLLETSLSPSHPLIRQIANALHAEGATAAEATCLRVGHVHCKADEDGKQGHQKSFHREFDPLSVGGRACQTR